LHCEVILKAKTKGFPQATLGSIPRTPNKNWKFPKIPSCLRKIARKNQPIAICSHFWLNNFWQNIGNLNKLIQHFRQLFKKVFRLADWLPKFEWDFFSREPQKKQKLLPKKSLKKVIKQEL
jgi:hypothetical protein